MQEVAIRNRVALLVFAGIAIGVYTVALILGQRLPTLEGANLVAIGLTIDIAVMVPLAFYLLVVRRRGLPLVRLAPVLVLSLLIASLIIPRGHQGALRILEYLLVPFEIGLVGWVLWRAVKAWRNVRGEYSVDPVVQIRDAALGVIRSDRIAGILATEISVLYYSFGSWRVGPHIPAGMAEFTHHRRCGQIGIVFALLFLSLAEGIGLHLILANWSLVAAWIFTSLTAIGMLWLIADFRATVQRPILVGHEKVVFRSGLRWDLVVPRAWISDIGRGKPEPGPESLNMAFLGTATHWIRLSRTVTARGPYGIRRQVRTIGIHPDEAGDLERALFRDLETLGN